LAEKIVRKRERAKGHSLPFEIASYDLDFSKEVEVILTNKEGILS